MLSYTPKAAANAAAPCKRPISDCRCILRILHVMCTSYKDLVIDDEDLLCDVHQPQGLGD